MLPAAAITHSAPGRTRFKIPERRRDAEYFATAVQRLHQAPDVDRVEANPLTGSVLVHHRGSAEALAEFAQANELFRASTLPQSVPDTLRREGPLVDRQLRTLSGNGVDLQSAVLLLMLGMGVVQLLRGEIAGPAVTLFWYAATLAAAADGGSRSGSSS